MVQAALLLGCSGAPSEMPAEDAPKIQPLSLPTAPDADPDPNVVAVSLIAAPADLELVPGLTTRVKAYSGTLPGPLIVAKRGDRLKVRLENQLTEPTTLHFHGVRLPNAMDGVPDMTQPAVAPGGTFDYAFELPDAGLYWYHPHADTLNEMGGGLYGAILVRDPAEPPELGDETVLVLSDIGLDAQGSVMPPATTPDAIIAGSEGNVVLVNGQVHPTLRVEKGRRQRFRVLNAARARYFRLSVAGHSFTQIGSDGGALEMPVTVAEPVIVPGERLDLLLDLEADAGPVELVSQPISRGLPLPESPEQALVHLEVTANGAAPSPPLPALSRAITPFATAGAASVPIALTVDESTSAVVMGINGVPGDEADPIHATVGSTQVLVVQNSSPYAHPFHLHGFFFQPLDSAGNPVHPLAFKDTIDIPPVTLQKLAVFYDDRPG
ncbi:MAG TPA: multicopper oxidase family protein, partial [Polyangiaceae bacterium]|nr:multicopper oxidase family protein [Polyangiaceae bacterium]